MIKAGQTGKAGKTLQSIKAGAKGAGFMGAVGTGTVGVGLGLDAIAGKNDSFDSAAKTLTSGSNSGFSVWGENTVMTSSAPIAPLGSQHSMKAHTKLIEDRIINNRDNNSETSSIEESSQTPHEVSQFLDNHDTHEVTVKSSGGPKSETTSETKVKVDKAVAKVILAALEK